MWASWANGSATWWMWALATLATISFWVMVAYVLRLIVTRSSTSSRHDHGAPGPDVAPTTNMHTGLTTAGDTGEGGGARDKPES